jgi:hypothetical protein
MISRRGALGALILSAVTLTAISPRSVRPQQPSGPTNAPGVALSRDTTLQAGAQYARGALWRALFGNNYRDLWTRPITVPLLDLATYAGGLTADKEGGHGQTKTLHFTTHNGVQYVFRPVFKARFTLPDSLKGTILETFFTDQLSASYPAAPLLAAPFVQAAGVLHTTPELVVMPNDTVLGAFRHEFAGKLGAIEVVPTKLEDAPGFADAVEIIDSDSLLKLLNDDPREHVDARAFLTARLVDMLIGDNDRYAGQWRWARLRPGKDSPWEPIPNDRDNAFVSHEGLVPLLARLVIPQAITFDKTFPGLHGLNANAIESDRRLLVSLDEPAWDSVAKSLARSITDSVIDAAVRNMPHGYETRSLDLAAKLKSRRTLLPNAAGRYYAALFREVDLHATDTNDRATIGRSADGVVDVRLQSGDGAPYFQRRFDVGTTKEIRLYLHGGDDTAVVTGHARTSIALKIIGGNGTNTLIDSSSVNGQTHLVRRYDAGHVEKWSYQKDSVNGVVFDPDTAWNRRPWVVEYGETSPPQRDRGATVSIFPGLVTGAGLGFTPALTVIRERYGFRSYPYLSKYELSGAYSYAAAGAKVELTTDNRRENSPIHFLTDEFMSRIELVEFHGFGNDVPDLTGTFFDVRQTQWVIHPAVGFALNKRSDVSVGPIGKYVTTNTTRNQFVALEPPYGAGRFGQAGVQADLRYDSRDHPGYPERGAFAIASASVYPGILTAKKGGAFEEVSALASTYVRIPVLTGTVLAVRVGGKKLFGDYPYYEAAYVGGASTIRTYEFRQYLGDASLFGTAELRVPVAKFTYLMPLNFGLLGFGDAGRVSVNGNSPGGWHTVAGIGCWLGALSPGTGVTVMLSNRPQNRVSLGWGFSF